ncbi:hypothetical protein [Thalassospira sp. GB04J01]|uniref:hypothetical protein n=1 Tax=Thalassospira sp. GB04J01 TaxID=1485225 RepID=UPI000C9B0CF9|nr:hypothetical protein [Thalassospira sp. GB04J01]|tara:strand:- start:29128 stop:29688 length:561 start_codon:yes stop_codon:yes gene_type:complete
MKNNLLAFSIASGATIMFCIGVAAGVSMSHSEAWELTSDSTFRLQWEVVLTGLFGLVGGYLAYRGATHNTRHQLSVAAAMYLHKNNMLRYFVAATDPTHDMGRLILGEYRNGNIDMVKDLAQTAIVNMGELPFEISTNDNIDLYRKAHSSLELMTKLTEPREPVLMQTRHHVRELNDVLVGIANST